MASGNFCEQKYSKRTRGRIVLKKTEQRRYKSMNEKDREAHDMLSIERFHELEALTERKALHHMELLKAELLATVSHELRSPLASIKGYAATLLRHEHRIARDERHEFLVA